MKTTVLTLLFGLVAGGSNVRAGPYGVCFVRRIALIGIVVASYSTTVRADEFYKHAAYCIGGLQSRIESRDRDFKISEATEHLLNSIRDLKANIFLHKTVVKHAIERGEIDEATAEKMKRSGYEDQNACDNGIDKCFHQFLVRRNDKMDDEQNNNLFGSCIVEPTRLCEQIKEACEE